MPPSHRVDADQVFLPVAELDEEHTHLDCPACDVGEIPLKKAATLRCDVCRAEFELHLHPVES